MKSLLKILTGIKETIFNPEMALITAIMAIGTIAVWHLLISLAVQ